MAIEDTVGKHHGKGIGGALVKGAVITAAVGILGSAALLAYANVSNTPIPELWQNITRRLHQEEYVPPRPTQQPSQLTTYQRQALEQIAAIRQKEPGLAQLLPQTDWFVNGVNQQEVEFVTKIRQYLADGNYVLDKVTHNDGSVTNLLVLSADKDERDEALVKTQQYLPAISQLLRVEYKKQLLIIDIYEGGGGASPRNVSISTPTDLPHELTHKVYELEGDGDVNLVQTPVWLAEGLAEFITRYLRGGDAYVEDQYKVYLESIQQGIFKVEPLSKIEPGLGKIEGRSYSLGFMFLVDYRNLVGEENFWDALLHVHDVKVIRGITANKLITHQDLEEILEQHVPQAQLPQFEQLYQQRVYGVQETEP